jgi:hypothetical protein
MRATRFWFWCAAVIAPVTGCSNEETAPLGPEVHVSRGAPGDTWLDLTVIGEGFADAERVVVQIGHPDRPPDRLGRAVAAIVDGSFTIRIPAVLESGLYKAKRVWIDADGDDRCGGADAVFTDFSAPFEPLTMRVPDPFQAAACADMVAEWPDE